MKVECPSKPFTVQRQIVSPYYWRTASGAEVDLLIEHRNRLIPFEIKLGSAPQLKDVLGLVTCMADLHLPKGYVIYPGTSDYSLSNNIWALAAEPLFRNPERFLKL